MSFCILKYDWKDYDSFNQLVEKLLYLERSPSFYRSENNYEYSEEDFTGLPLGVKKADSKSMAYYQQWHWHRFSEVADFIGAATGECSSFHELEDLKVNKIYLELSSGGDGPLEKRAFKEMNKTLAKYLKSSGVDSDTEEFDVYLLRFYGLIAYHAARYLQRKKGLSISIYSGDDHKRLEKAVTCLTGYVRKGLPLPANAGRVEVIALLKKIEEINSPDKNEMQLYPENHRYDNPELISTLRDFSLFLSVVGGPRSPTFIKSIFSIFDQDLTDKKVKDFLRSFKTYLISKGVNRKKILLRLLRKELLPPGEEDGLNDMYSLPSLDSCLLDESQISEKLIAEYEKLV